MPVPEGLKKPMHEAKESDGRTVFVVHGRNARLRQEFFSFLRAAGLDPLEWSEAVRLTGQGAPYIGEILDRAFAEAAAVIVLLTPDDEVRLSPGLLMESDGASERDWLLQPRPNVLFEAGMAFGRHPDRTILVVVGSPKPFSDVAGRHVVHLSNDVSRRIDLIDRLRQVGCSVKVQDRRDWLDTGDFSLQVPFSETQGPSRAGTDHVVPPADLSEEEVAVLSGIVRAQGPTSVGSLAEYLHAGAVEIQYQIDRLMGRGYVTDVLRRGRPPLFMPTKEGRAFVVENSLI